MRFSGKTDFFRKFALNLFLFYNLKNIILENFTKNGVICDEYS